MDNKIGKPVLAIVVPCYNEQEVLPETAKKLSGVLQQLISEKIIDESSTLLFVDDGSSDNTLNILRQLANQENLIHYISFSRNFGKEAAILAGLQAAHGEYIVTLDADGQDPLSLILQMLEVVVSGEYDCAATCRVSRTGEPVVRSFFARCFYSFMKKISDIEVVDGARDFRLMNRKYLEAILAMPERNRFSKGIYPWVGFKTKWFEYENVRRTAGKTKWSLWKLFVYSLDGITAFSSKPLAISSVFGILLFVIALSFIIFIVIRKIVCGDPVGDWASTICIILFCSGIQLLTTGIMGQYIAKTYTEVKQRPYFVVKEMQ